MALGIDNLKKLIKFSLDISENISSALADGKITTVEIFGFLPELMQVPGVVKSWKDIVAEVKDLMPDERIQLHAFVADEFDIPNDKVEVFIEHSLEQIISLNALILEFKKLDDPVEENPDL